MTEARYDIEEKTEYRYRKRDFRYFELADKYEFAGNYVRTDTEYGEWSTWQTVPIPQKQGIEVLMRGSAVYEYRSRPVREKYIYKELSDDDWSEWSGWSGDKPYINKKGVATNEVEERVMYRYKEK